MNSHHEACSLRYNVGYIPGKEQVICSACGKPFIGAKTATICKACADKTVAMLLTSSHYIRSSV
jgi:hypothetical protein